MTRIRRGRHVLATLLAIATIAVVAANPAIAGAAVTAPPPPAGAALPANWPSDVPVPPGELQGSTGGDGLWSVQLLVNGSAAQVLQSALDFYVAAGYATVATRVLLPGAHRLPLVTQERDHSKPHTFLLIRLEGVPAPPRAPAPPVPRGGPRGGPAPPRPPGPGRPGAPRHGADRGRARPPAAAGAEGRAPVARAAERPARALHRAGRCAAGRRPRVPRAAWRPAP